MNDTTGIKVYPESVLTDDPFCNDMNDVYNGPEPDEFFATVYAGPDPGILMSGADVSGDDADESEDKSLAGRLKKVFGK
jgi:hypothetical protein